MAKSPRMRVDDVLEDMRANGMSISKAALCHCLREGIFPFAHIIGIGPTGRADFLIMRKDYEEWAEEYLYNYASA
ncbi:MAG: hypothetical protein IKA47_11365 [Oscillospiraceae bacterium]|nr:hypothetical protein [Oscillospiraceae bacterium]MBR2422036.1 hypothetical protein [Oscillospiraceae bacterium]